MYHITFPQASNRASWMSTCLITDLDDNPIDLAGCKMVFAIKNKHGDHMMEASIDNGKLTLVGLGTFSWFFTVEEMRQLCAEQYETGLTLTNDDDTQTVQLSVGPLTIVDGVVP